MLHEQLKAVYPFVHVLYIISPFSYTGSSYFLSYHFPFINNHVQISMYSYNSALQLLFILILFPIISLFIFVYTINIVD